VHIHTVELQGPLVSHSQTLKEGRHPVHSFLFFIRDTRFFRIVHERIWSLVVACLLELVEQAHGRAVFMGNMSMLTEETAGSGEDSMESDEGSTESDEEIPAEDVESTDGVLLRKFTETEAWVQLDESLRPRSQ
jgi:hypothetical protein